MININNELIKYNHIKQGINLKFIIKHKIVWKVEFWFWGKFLILKIVIVLKNFHLI